MNININALKKILRSESYLLLYLLFKDNKSEAIILFRNELIFKKIFLPSFSVKPIYLFTYTHIDGIVENMEK